MTRPEHDIHEINTNSTRQALQALFYVFRNNIAYRGRQMKPRVKMKPARLLTEENLSWNMSLMPSSSLGWRGSGYNKRA